MRALVALVAATAGLTLAGTAQFQAVTDPEQVQTEDLQRERSNLQHVCDKDKQVVEHFKDTNEEGVLDDAIRIATSSYEDCVELLNLMDELIAQSKSSVPSAFQPSPDQIDELAHSYDDNDLDRPSRSAASAGNADHMNELMHSDDDNDRNPSSKSVTSTDNADHVNEPVPPIGDNGDPKPPTSTSTTPSPGADLGVSRYANDDDDHRPWYLNEKAKPATFKEALGAERDLVGANDPGWRKMGPKNVCAALQAVEVSCDFNTLRTLLRFLSINGQGPFLSDRAVVRSCTSEDCFVGRTAQNKRLAAAVRGNARLFREGDLTAEAVQGNWSAKRE
jgi:hypothetical protein